MSLIRCWRGRLLVVALLATWPGFAFSQLESKPFIAVLDLDVAGGTREQALALSSQLRVEILKTGRFTVVDRSQVDAILDEQTFQQSGCTSQECAVQVGRILGIRQIVSGGVIKVSDQLWQVSALLIDVETSETLRSETLNHEGPYRDLLFTGMRRMAELLALAAPPPRTSLAAAKPVPPPTAPPAAVPPPPPQPAESLAAWRLKWASALALGLAAGYYGYAEAQALTDSNDQRQKILAAMEAAATLAEYEALQQKLESERDAAKSHRQNAYVGYGAAAVLLGLAAWVYFDAPDGSTGEPPTTWMPMLLPGRDGFRAAVIARW